MSLKETLEQAEINAKKRDRLVEEEKYINLEIVNEIEEKANKLGYSLYKIKDMNHASFTQTINDNWDIIIRNNYLTTGELAFILSIQSLIEFNSNAIVCRKTGQFMTVSEIAKYLNRDRSGVSQTIQSLLEKGVLLNLLMLKK